MTEALEYRVKQNKVLMAYLTGMLTVLAGMVTTLGSLMLKSTTIAPILVFFGLACVIFGFAIGTIGKAMQSQSTARQFWSQWYTFEDPPIDVWETQLERDGAFQAREWNE